MAVTAPTVEEFGTRFPVFGEADPELIATLLAEAIATVPNDFEQADYTAAILYLTAHLLATDASEEGAEIDDGASEIAAESFSGMSVSYRTPASSGSSERDNTYGGTSYGRRFLTIWRRYGAGISAVVA